MDTIGDRLKSERLRLGITQEEMAKAGGVARSAQANYEKGERSPDSNYLVSIYKIGVDVNYVITGLGIGNESTQSAGIELPILEKYNRLNSEDKKFIERIVNSLL